MAGHSPSKKPRYNLNLVVQETGLKPDTLRAWERRYQVPLPERSDGGQRLYSDYDLEAIRWLKRQLADGMRISQAAEYWRDLIAAGRDPLERDSLASPGPAAFGSEPSGRALSELTKRWLELILEYDEQGAEQVLSQAFAQFPIEIVIRDLIILALNQIGNLWQAGEATVQQEHFGSELATRKLQALLTSAPLPYRSQKILLFSPAGELHILPLLMLNLLLRFQGWDVLYLGANLPIARLKETIQAARPALGLLSVSRLASIPALIDTVEVLREHRIPTAYGGWIFRQDRSLTGLVPAHYLGDDVSQVGERLGTLLENPTLSVLQPSAGEQEAILEFTGKLAALEQQVGPNLGVDLVDPQDLENANQHLRENILAALRLGDLNLLEGELGWVRSLLSTPNLPESFFAAYLQAYYQAARQVLGEAGRPILNWLESVQNDQPKQE